MSLTLVLAVWALVLLIPAVIKMRNRGIHTSVSKFHNQLIVLGRTSTFSSGSAEIQTTQTYLWAHSSTSRVKAAGYSASTPNTGVQASSADTVRWRQQEIRQRRAMVVFSLLVLFLVSALVMVLAFSAFTATLTVSTLAALSLYVALLVRMRNTAALRAQYRARSQNAAFQYESALGQEVLRPALNHPASPPIRIAKTFDVARAN